VAAGRDAIAPGLVHDDAQFGMPTVAPFVLDQPAAAQPSAQQSEGHRLLLRLGNLSASFPIVKDVTTIGRPDSSTQNYPDVEVEIDDGVSRKHAEIRWQDDGYYLVDVGSTNGTILNGEMLPPQHPTLLTHGDRIRIGERTEILFE
jgi:pSer/pThr/pTyr-binding forkhead associated (FHA) protein